MATYVYGNYVDEPLTMRRGGQDYYYLADDSHNVVALTDSTGTVVERYGYGNFGRPTVYDANWNTRTATAYGNPYLFTGRRYDPETGLYWYRTRYYDPRAGRFTSRDTIGIWGDMQNIGNGLTYVGNNSWTMLDPFGYCSEKSSFEKFMGDLEKAMNRGLKEFLTGDPDAPDQAVMAAAQEFGSSMVDRSLGTADAAVENVTLGLVDSVGGTAYDEANRAGAKSTAGTIIATAEMATGVAGIARGVAKRLGREGGEAANRALFERYKDSLRRAMSRPPTKDPALTRTMDKLYREGAKIGSGSTADAVRYERMTGQKVGGSMHTQKAQELAQKLRDWVRSNPTADSADRAAAENVLRDLENALSGN